MKKIIVAIVCFMMLLQITVIASAKEYPQRFWDVPKNHWAFGYIAEFADRGIVNGYGDGSFRPEKQVSRAEWVKMMAETAALKTDDDNIYYDDLKGHWAIKYVNATKDYLGAFSNGLYYPNQAATREEVTISMVKLKGYDINEVDYSYLMKFNDLDSISDSAKKFVAVAVQNGLITGYEDNTFRGRATLTRAEAATLLFRALSTQEKIQGSTTQKDFAAFNGNYEGGGTPIYDSHFGETVYIGSWNFTISDATAESLSFGFSINESDFNIVGTLYRQNDGSYYGSGFSYEGYESYVTVWLESHDCIVVTPDAEYLGTEKLYKIN